MAESEDLLTFGQPLTELVRNCVMSYTVTGGLSRAEEAKVFKLRELWRHSHALLGRRRSPM
jgi:hypothetical protein